MLFRSSGGNGARNYGFLQSNGEYIQWFDSDDLMHPEKLEKKVVASNYGSVDFVISKTKYFNRPNHQPYEYFYSDNDITFLKYSISNVSWFTPDMFIKRNIAIDVSFNEFLKAGQEYNYSCKLLLHVKTAKKVDEFLTFRRYHDESIGKKRQIDKDHYYTTKFQAHWFTYLDISNLYFIQEFNRYSLLECISYYLRSRNSITLPQGFMEELKKVFKNKVLYFHLAKLSNRLFGRYHFFYKKLKQN